MTQSKSLALFAFILMIQSTYNIVVVHQPQQIRSNAWEGWGTSLAWWAKTFGDRDDIADVMFTESNVNVAQIGKTIPGLGLNIARYNAGASSWNTYSGTKMQVGPNMIPSRQIEGLWIDWGSRDPASSSWVWSNDANQRNMLLKAQARGANKFELFSNSPMWWMCSNKNPAGSPTGSTDNLQEWNQNDFAYYLATIAKEYSTKYKIHFESVEAFNEPSSHWWTPNNNQEGCFFSRATQVKVVENLRQILNSYGLSTVLVSASDENSYTLALETWNSFTSTIKSKIGRVNVHGYEGGGGRRDLLFDAAQKDGKAIWNSEYGDGDASGNSMVSNLNLDLQWLKPTAWVYWQVLDGGGWGLLSCDHNSKKVLGINDKYYKLAQFTRHVKAGMHLVDMPEDAQDIIVAVDLRNLLLVCVISNTSTEEVKIVNLDLSNLQLQLQSQSNCSGCLYRIETKRWITDSEVKYQKSDFYALSLEDKVGVWDYQVLPSSVHTIEIQLVKNSE